MFLRIYLVVIMLMGVSGVATCQTLNNQSEPAPSTLMIPEGLEKPIVIAVIDSGFDFKSDWKNMTEFPLPKLCRQGHKDFTGHGLQDVYGHGTHVAGLIGKEISDINYCIVAIKFWHNFGTNTGELNSRRAIMRAIDLDVDVINISGGGSGFDMLECTLVKRALDKGIIVVAAAGNEGKDINKQPYYPAMCDDRVIAVANVNIKHQREPSSNYSPVGPGNKILYEEIGYMQWSIIPDNGLGFMTGTSQSTAIMTGKIVRRIKEQRHWKWHEYRARPRKGLDA